MNDTVMPADMNQIGQELNNVTTAIAEGQTIPAPISRGVNVIQSDQASGATFKVIGNTICNILGSDGGCESLTPFTIFGETTELSTTQKRSGTYSVKMSRSDSNGNAYIYRDYTYILDQTKNYLLCGWVYIDSYVTGSIVMGLRDLNTLNGRYSINPNTSLVGKWQFVSIKIPKANTLVGNGFRLLFGLTGLNNNATVYFDEIRMYEVSDSDSSSIGTTITGAAIDARWPYVDSVQHTRGLSVAMGGGNMNPPFTAWGISPNASIVNPYEMRLVATASFQNSFIDIPCAPSTTYTVSLNSLSGRMYIEGRAADKSSLGILGGTEANVFVRTVTTQAGAKYIRIILDNRELIGTFTFSNLQLELGNVATTFEPRTQQYANVDTILASNVDRSIADSYDSATGQAFRRWELGYKVDGSLPVTFANNYTGYKRVNVPISYFSGTIKQYGPINAVKYNGSVIKDGNSEIAADTWNSGTSALWISLSNAETGWVDGITPTALAAKAPFNGWKANGNNGSVYNSWVSVLTGAAPATNTEAYVAANKAPGWDAYATLDYVRATPITEQLSGDLGGMAMVKGGNMVELLEGVVVREKVTPFLSGGLYYINDTNLPVSKLDYRAEKILAVYKGAEIDPLWRIQFGAGNAYGSGKAVIAIADYDPAAEYFVDYIALDKHTYTVNAVDATLVYRSTLGGAVAQATQDIAKLQQHEGIQNFALDYIEAKADNNALDLNTLSASLGTAAQRNTGTLTGNIPVLGNDGKLADSVLPNLSITDTFVVSSQAAMLALTAQVGDVAVRTDLNKTFILRVAGAFTLANWQELLTPPNTVLSVAGKTGAVVLEKEDVGLGSVDNAKQMPISGGTFLGPVVAAATSPGTRAVRNITLSTFDPFGGQNGDVWIKYV
jgi:hypothetical protein